MRRADELQRLTGAVDVSTVTADYERAQRAAAEARGRHERIPDRLAGDLESLRRQHRSAQRLLNALDDIDDRLGVVHGRLRELLLAAGEMSLGASGPAAADSAERHMEGLADEAQALRAALTELA